MTVVMCRACGRPLPSEALSWPSATDLCSVACGERVGMTDAVLQVLRQREERAAGNK